MPLSTKPYKGARDFYPEDKRMQKYIFGVMRSVVERYGYEEYDAPILEPTEIFASKTSDEIVNEQTYTFIDRGDRSVTIRTEMTPSVSRMVAGRRQELSYPARWYSIPNLWRYERPQRGRLREFWQLNVDVFGIDNLSAEHEMIMISNDIMKAFGATPSMFEIKVNSRKLINSYLLDVLGLDETQALTMVRLIDRKDKISRAEFVGQADTIFSPSQRDAGGSERLFVFLEATDLDNIPDSEQLSSSIGELRQLMRLLESSGITNAVFDPSLMRGFDYYTDIVFEVFDTKPDNNRSMFGGGRYDGLIGLFGVEPIPTVGFGMGDVTIQNFLESRQMLPELRADVDLAVLCLGDVYEQATKIAAELRQMGLNVAVDSTKRKIDKLIKSAVKSSVRYVLFVGEKEVSTQQFILKDLRTGKDEQLSLQRVVSTIKDFRTK